MTQAVRSAIRSYTARARRLSSAVIQRRTLQPRDVPIERDWGGPIDRTPTSLPILGRLGGREHLLYGVGWSGNGVGPSHLGGRMLASLALGTQDEWSTNGLIDRDPDPFPPEPVRFLGARLVREAVIRKERSELAGRPPRRLAVRVAALAPAGLEDKA